MDNYIKTDTFITPVYEIPAPFGYETRGVNCPDGVVRLLTYPKQIWDWSDHFIEEKLFSRGLVDEIESCWDFTQERFPDKVHDTFPRIFFYNIIGVYEIYNGIGDLPPSD